MKKLISMLLVLCMVLGMSVSVFAAEPTTIEVETKDALKSAIANANGGDVIQLTADIAYTGTETLTIDKAITLDLGGKTLTTEGTYGGLSLKNGCSVVNGTIQHNGTVAAIKAWNVDTLENLTIDVAFKAEGKVIGGIVIQNVSTNRIETIKNVTIQGEGLTNGIETYNCGDASENVIGSMENVTINATKTAMNISAPCGTATNCSFTGGESGIEIWIKGTYSATLALVNCTVSGGTQDVYAHDEFNSADIENNGELVLTADSDTVFTHKNIKVVNDHSSEITVPEFSVVAKIGDTEYETLEEAAKVAEDGNEIKILKTGTYTLPSNIKSGVTITGAVDGVVFEMGESQPNMDGADITFNNITFNWAAHGWPYHGLQHCGDMKYNNCTINGTVFLYGPSEIFTDCTFNVTGDTYNVWTYGAKEATFTNCTFNSAGKSVLIYKESDESGAEFVVDFENCKFIASTSVEGKAAIEIDASFPTYAGEDYPSYTVTIDGATTQSGFANGSVSGNPLWNVKKPWMANPEPSVNGDIFTYAGENATVIVTEKAETPPPTDNNTGSTDDDWYYEEIEEDDDTESLVVRIKFDDVDESLFDEIKVNLLRNGKKYDSELLSASKNSKKDWRVEWDDLDEDYEWSVDLAAELEGYEAEIVNLRGNYWTITLSEVETTPVVSTEKANPSTGAADFVGAAVALAVVSAAGMGALSLKK